MHLKPEIDIHPNVLTKIDQYPTRNCSTKLIRHRCCMVHSLTGSDCTASYRYGPHHMWPLRPSSACNRPVIDCLRIALYHLPLSPHIYAWGNRISIGSDNGLSPIRRQANIYTNAGLLTSGPLKTNFGEILIKMQNFPFTKMHIKISSAIWRPFCPGGD